MERLWHGSHSDHNDPSMLGSFSDSDLIKEYNYHFKEKMVSAATSLGAVLLVAGILLTEHDLDTSAAKISVGLGTVVALLGLRKLSESGQMLRVTASEFQRRNEYNEQ